MSERQRSIADVVKGPFDEGALRERIEGARALLAEERCDLALVYVSADLMGQSGEIVEMVQVHGRARLLAGCSGLGVLGNGEEVEEGPALAFALLRLPGARLVGAHVTAGDVEAGLEPEGWRERLGTGVDETGGWLAFGDPYSLDAESWLRQWNEAFPGVPMVGGLAGAGAGVTQTQLYLNQRVLTEGAVVVSVGGEVGIEAIVSQGCRPIGKPWTVTGAEQNLIHQIGNLPALTVLQETFDGLPARDKERARGNIFVGLAVNEYQEEHRRGDFLVRNLLAADPNSGVVAVGARVRIGQTLQFQFRDGGAADEDLVELIEGVRRRLAGREVHAACLCSCAGRGAQLFGRPDHDAGAVHRGLGGEVPLAGFFGNGEIGPVGGRNFLHGYTAAAALFVSHGDRDIAS
ncbi:MAG: FIST C-terminal domain-containing protein [Verrucomicrobiae bacterium]|nr:FIST C-terminal domain-containing protein [Verrucomicrobiae bacterium]